MVALDPRINPFRPEIAASHLRGQVEARRFVEGKRHQVIEPAAALRLTRLPGTEPATTFSVATPDGKVLALSDHRGKVVVLNFWATWCEPCLEEMPAMARVARAYQDRGLVVLALQQRVACGQQERGSEQVPLHFQEGVGADVERLAHHGVHAADDRGGQDQPDHVLADLGVKPVDPS